MVTGMNRCCAGNVGGAADTAKSAKPRLMDRKLTLLISAGAAMAANCESCLRKIVTDLKRLGASTAEIQRAILTGQMVKDKPASIMKELADELAGTTLSRDLVSESCPGDAMEVNDEYRVMMLIAAGSAIAANCEYCLNKVIPDLIEAGTSEADIRRAVEIGQFVKDKPASIMKEAADILTGSRLSAAPVSKACTDKTAEQSSPCCA